MFVDYFDMYPFYQFHGFYDHTKSNNNIISRWLSDNCQKTNINGKRSRYGLIGNFNESKVLQDLREDIGNVLYVRKNAHNLTNNF